MTGMGASLSAKMATKRWHKSDNRRWVSSSIAARSKLLRQISPWPYRSNSRRPCGAAYCILPCEFSTTRPESAHSAKAITGKVGGARGGGGGGGAGGGGAGAAAREGAEGAH